MTFGGKTCTGIVASWCPNHGTCTCPRNDDGEIEWHWEPGIVSFHGIPAFSETARSVTHHADNCPLHGELSDHPTSA